MKKIITLALLAVTVMTANAANRKWDFTKWSTATIEQVKNASDWTNDEKGDGSSNVVPDKACMWNAASSVSAACNADGYLMAGGSVIAELEGLKWAATAAKKIAMAFDYTITTDANKWGPYDGPAYLWLNGKTTAVHFTIPAVKPGATITIKCESHKPSDARGVDILVGGNKVAWTSGQTGYPTAADTYVWTVPESEEETVDVDVQPSNGTHLYYINVEEGGSSEEAKNVAWVSGDPANDMYKALAPTTGINYADIAATATMTADELRAYDAVVVSTDVDADSPMAKLLEENIGFVPMVNLSQNIFGYSYGLEDGTYVALDKTSDLFAGVDLDEEGKFDYAAGTGVTLPERFANDLILAKTGDAVLFHQHNAKRNSYLFLSSDNAYAAASTNAWPTLLANAINMVAASHKAITAAANPEIALKYADGQTTATITCSTAGSTVYYKVGDGNYAPYTEALTFTEAATITAYAVAEGYMNSAETTKAVDIQTQAAAPAISVATEEGKATITITAAEGATIYYNFTGSDVKTQCSVYSEPIEVSENCSITALAEAEGQLLSAATTQTVVIPGLKSMSKVLGHFDANKAQWSNGESKAYYYCYGYDDGSGTKYKKYNVSNNYTVTYAPEGSEWTLRTSGQQVVWESTGPQKNIGDTGNYNPVSALDVIDNEITSCEITVGAVASYTGVASDGVTDSTYNDPQTFELVSTVKYQAPFNIVSYIGCKPGKVGFEYYVSTDNENWTLVSKSPESPAYEDGASKWRLWHRDLIQYTGTDEVYLKVKSISNDSYRIFDIFVKGEGEGETAIREVSNTSSASSVRKYTNNGQILIQTPNGTFTATGARVK